MDSFGKTGSSLKSTSFIKLFLDLTSFSNVLRFPEAYKAPINDPMLVPETYDIGICSSSIAFNTPICAYPLAAPPPNAIPILFFFIVIFIILITIYYSLNQ